MYGEIIIPDAVMQELEEGKKRDIHLPSISSHPWIEIKKINSPLLLPYAVDLGRGEREVLTLAAEESDSFVILDDGLARRYAKLLNLRYSGTLGILLKAKKLGLLTELKPILTQLTELNFHLDETTRNKVLKMAEEI